MLRPIENKENKYPISKEDIKELTEKIINFNKKYSMYITINNSLPFCSYDKEKLKEIVIGSKHDDGRSILVIDSEGNIKPDYFSEKILGNISKDNLLDCWNNDFCLDIRNLKLVPEECKICKYLLECKAGSRFSAWLINGDYNKKDPLMN